MDCHFKTVQFLVICGDSSYAITVRDADSSVYTSVIFLNQPSEFSFQTDVQEN